MDESTSLWIVSGDADESAVKPFEMVDKQFGNIPLDLWEVVLQHLNLSSLGRLACCCKASYNAVLRSRTWEGLCTAFLTVVLGDRRTLYWLMYGAYIPKEMERYVGPARFVDGTFLRITVVAACSYAHNEVSSDILRFITVNFVDRAWNRSSGADLIIDSYRGTVLSPCNTPLRIDCLSGHACRWYAGGNYRPGMFSIDNNSALGVLALGDASALLRPDEFPSDYSTTLVEDFQKDFSPWRIVILRVRFGTQGPELAPLINYCAKHDLALVSVDVTSHESHQRAWTIIASMALAIDERRKKK